MRLRALITSRRGSVAVEFAMIAPVFLGLLFGTMEYCRVLWTTQSLNAVAYSTARCVTYSANCATLTTARNHAVSLAGTYGITVINTNVTSTANTTCRGNGGQNMIQVSATFNSALAGLEPVFPATITGTGCFTT
jgi:Flp pilus assembly protein TadG